MARLQMVDGVVDEDEVVDKISKEIEDEVVGGVKDEVVNEVEDEIEATLR